MKKLSIKEELTEFLLYSTPNGNVKIEVILNEETVWLSQKSIAQLFGVQVPAISKHLKNIFETEELNEELVISILETTALDNKKYQVKYFNLDAIISVGYRVNSRQATKFRIWATQTLKEYIVKGFVMDDERLKNGRYFGKDYFKELLERVRSIRSSERRIYQQITDVFAECSIDYDSKSEITKEFYATVQNKFHFAIHGKTAAEIIYRNADAEKEFMGLNTWKNAPEGRVLKSDTNIAKNYLTEKKIKNLERTISSYFDYIERIIETRNTFTMEQFTESVNKFLDFNEYKILEGRGKVSAKQAEQKAFTEYDRFNKVQKIESDFDKAIKKLRKGIILLTLVFYQLSLMAQVIIPIPVDTTAVWRIERYHNDSQCVYNFNSIYYVNGTEIKNGEVYYKIYEEGNYWEFPTHPEDTVCNGEYVYSGWQRGGIRTENGKVYGYTMSDSPTLLMDFTLNIGDTMYSSICLYGKVIESIDSVLVGYEYRKRFNFADSYYCNWMIEGVGHDRGLFESMDDPFENGSDLICYGENSIPIFGNQNCDITVGLTYNIENNDKIDIFPNPTSNKVTINTSLLTNEIKSYFITDISGRLLLQNRIIETGDNKYEIDLSNINSGLYLLNIVIEDSELKTFKIIKK